MNNKIFACVAAFVSAGLASICCVGPIILTGLGLGGIGMATGLSRYRSLFLILTGLILIVGFYLAYKKRTPCADGSCKLSSGSRIMRFGLWIITLITLAVATFPDWVPYISTNTPAVVTANAQMVSLNISDMECAACAITIKKFVEKVPGVISASVDFDSRRAVVVTNGKADLQAVINAVAEAGYKAEILNEGRHE